MIKLIKVLGMIGVYTMVEVTSQDNNLRYLSSPTATINI